MSMIDAKRHLFIATLFVTKIRKELEEFLLWLSELKTQPGLCVDVSSIPALAQWVKDFSIVSSCGICCRCGLDPVLQWFVAVASAAVPIWPLDSHPIRPLHMQQVCPLKVKKKNWKQPKWLSVKECLNKKINNNNNNFLLGYEISDIFPSYLYCSPFGVPWTYLRCIIWLVWT